MQSTADHLDLAPPRSGRWLGPVGLALGVHAVLIIALTWGVNWKHDDPTVTFEAEIWSRLPQQAAPRAVEPPPPPPPPPQLQPAPAPPPPPAPAPAPPPPAPPAPNEAQIAIEQAKKKAEAEKRERDAAARKAAEAKKLAEAKKAEERKAAEARAAAEKRAQAEKERKERVAREAAEKREQDRRLAAEREEATRKAIRDDQMRRITGQAGATGGPQSTGTAQQSSGPSPGYAGRVAARIRPNVLFTESAPGNPRAEIEIRTQPNGTITSSRLVKSSGNPAWDAAALRAIERTGTLPQDTDGRVPSSLIIGLRPQD